MRLTWFVTRISWPLCLTIVLAIALLNQWYFKTGYITYGDFHLNGASDVLPGAFHLWTTTGGLGHAESINWWHRAFLGVLFALHLNDALAQRIVWLYFPPPIFIAGLFLLAKTFTRDNTAAGVAALAGFLNVDFLVRVIGGHGTVLMAIALGPWIVLATIQAMRTRHPAWFAAITLSLAVATAYDARWSLPVFVLCMVVVIGLTCANRRQSVAPAIAALGAMMLGLILPNLPWLFAAAVSTAAISPMPAGNLASPVWVHRLSLATLPDALAIWNPTFGSDFDRGAFTIAHLPGWGLLFPALIFLSVAMSRRRSAWLFFVGYAAGAFLYKGDEWPAGSLYFWAFRHVPLFGLYREPLKFGAIASLCGCVVLALGISALRKWPIAKQLAALAAAITIVALAAPAFSKPGTRVTRVPGPQYAQIRSILSRDPAFSRVLWLPESSRWAFGTHDHPIVDGAVVGEEDWSEFRYDKGIDADPTGYVNSALFPQLLRWHSIGYVVVDCDTEGDATFRSESYSCIQILRSLAAAKKELTRMARAGPLTVFRVAGEAAPVLWSTASALRASGAALSFNAGARSGIFNNFVPIVQSTARAERLPFAADLIFDGAAPRRIHSREPLMRLIGADSVDQGPNAGDAIADQPENAPGLQLRKITYAQSTIAYNGTLAGAALSLPHRLQPFYEGSLLTRRGFESAAFSDRQAEGVETARASIAIFEKPSLSVSGDATVGAGTYLPLLELHDTGGRTYTLAGPILVQNRLPRTELDIRDWLFRTIVGNPAYNARLGGNDRFDGLILTRARLVRIGKKAFSKQRLSLSVRATTPENGYPVARLFTYPSDRFSCVCTKLLGPERTEFAIAHPGTRVPGWTDQVVAIYASSGNITAIIARETATAVFGIETAGVPFELSRREIRRVVSAPDQAAVDLHLATPANGVLVLRGRVDPHDGIEIFLKVPSRTGPEWVAVPPSMIEDVPRFVARVDLFAAAQRYGFKSILDAMLVVRHRIPSDRSSIRFEAADPVVVSNSGFSQSAVSGSGLRFYSRRLKTRLSSGKVPVAILLSNTIRTNRISVEQHPTAPAVDSTLQDNSGNRWLVLSQRFDPDWELVKADGSRVEATHVSIFGTLNGWYVPGGLHGAYRVFYAPDAAARLGGFIALIGMCVCALIALTAIPRRDKRRASAGMFPLVDEFDS